MWWRAELDGEQTGSRRGADEEQSLVMGVGNRETEASVQGGGQKDQRDGDGGKATLALDGKQTDGGSIGIVLGEYAWNWWICGCETDRGALNEVQLVEQAHGFDGLGGGWGANQFAEQEVMAHWIARTHHVCILGLSWIVDNCIEPDLWAGICWARVSCDGLGRQGG